jgi:hypothetical protein
MLVLRIRFFTFMFIFILLYIYSGGGGGGELSTVIAHRLESNDEYNILIRKLGITIYIRIHLYLNKSIAYHSAQDMKN